MPKEKYKVEIPEEEIQILREIPEEEIQILRIR